MALADNIIGREGDAEPPIERVNVLDRHRDSWCHSARVPASPDCNDTTR
jgi:hypothetical protein